MTMLGGIGLLNGIMAKMNWLDQNQRVIAQNVANSDTPEFRPSSLKDQDFKSMLGAAGKDASGGMSLTPVKLEATNPLHFGAMNSKDSAPAAGKQKFTYESSPDNNGVVLEEQLFKANENSINYQVATDLYRRNTGMLRMVLQGGRG